MTNDELVDYDNLKEKLTQDKDLIDFLGLYLIFWTENIETLKASGRDPGVERIKLQGIAELRKLLSDEEES